MIEEWLSTPIFGTVLQFLNTMSNYKFQEDTSNFRTVTLDSKQKRKQEIEAVRKRRAIIQKKIQNNKRVNEPS